MTEPIYEVVVMKSQKVLDVLGIILYVDANQFNFNLKQPQNHPLD